MSTIERWPDSIHLIGVGGIGTHVLLALIELGAREVHVWDPDFVDAHNRPNQFIYTKSDVGRFKVDGVQDFIDRQGYDITVIAHADHVTEDTVLEGIVISGVDSMRSRHVIWKSVRNNMAFVPIYIDGRIGNDIVHVFTIDPSDPYRCERYERTLLNDDEVADVGCTTRENPHAALAVAQIVSTHLTLLLAGESVKDAVYWDLRQEAKVVQRPLSVTA